MFVLSSVLYSNVLRLIFPLNSKAKCADTKEIMKPSEFSVGANGAPLMFPPDTEQGFKAALRMGAGMIRASIAFTKDFQLVCRMRPCELHLTTDVVLHPKLNAKCTTPWSTGVTPECCVADFTLAELKTLCAKMYGSGSVNSTTAEAYVYGGTPNHRTGENQYLEHLFMYRGMMLTVRSFA
jgi:glycerophosphoryl diester phosphodiesterase